jgi:hypothetical protein
MMYGKKRGSEGPKKSMPVKKAAAKKAMKKPGKKPKQQIS